MRLQSWVVQKHSMTVSDENLYLQVAFKKFGNLGTLLKVRKDLDGNRSINSLLIYFFDSNSSYFLNSSSCFLNSSSCLLIFVMTISFSCIVSLLVIAACFRQRFLFVSILPFSGILLLVVDRNFQELYIDVAYLRKHYRVGFFLAISSRHIALLKTS